jgi:hypothetical protein
MNGDFRPLFCPWNVFFSQSEQAFNHQIPLSQINAYFRDHFWIRIKFCWHVTTFLYFLWFWAWSHDEWRLPSIVLSLNVFFSVWASLQPSDPTFRNKRLLPRPLLTRIKFCCGKMTFFFFISLWFWAWSHHEWRLPSMVLSLNVFSASLSKPSTIRSHSLSQINAYSGSHLWHA